MDRIAVLIPCYNEAQTIAKVVRDFRAELPEIHAVPQDATYLMWLDFRGTGLSPAEIDRRIIHEAKLWLDSGRIFGKTGEGFQRINVAVPRATLTECMDRISDHVVEKA